MPIQYVTVYEISHWAPDWRFACAGMIPLLTGAVMIWGKRRFKWTQPGWSFAIICCLFGILWIGVVGSSVLLADIRAYDAYQDGKYRTVEGVVTGFHPMPYEGHQDECFSVQDQRFCYSDYEIAPGFHNATSHGGPIRADLPVRIAYRDGRILRLEVPSAQTLTPEQSATGAVEGERQAQQRAERDPMSRRMNMAFLFTATCWTLWWNLQWKRVIRFWLKPPYRPWVEVLFRVFFALNFGGSIAAFAQQLYSHPLPKSDIGPTIQIAAIMCSVVGLMSWLTLWRAEVRDASTANIQHSA